MLNTKLLGSVSAAPGEYIDDVFSTFLYTGNATARSIVNGIDIAGEGALIWTKSRNTAEGHYLVDSATGRTKFLQTNAVAAATLTSDITAFNSDGYSVNNDINGGWNNSGTNFVSWTFRKAPKFFDIVTYTGNAVANRQISHNLGSTPGMVIVKQTSGANPWMVYHRALSNQGDFLQLNSTAAADTRFSNFWGTTPFSSTTFSVSDFSEINGNGDTYVAYLFAHNAGGFGAAGTDNVISCGSFVTGSTGVETITLGYEPQYVMFKRADSTSGWIILDTMRGFPNGSVDAYLEANTSAAETTAGYGHPTATGFVINAGFGSGQTYIYMAIRRPMKPPTSGTQVFSPELTAVRGSFLTAPTAPDMVFSFNRNFDTPSGNTLSYSRLTGAKLLTSSTAAESSRNSNSFTDSMFFYQDFTSSPMVHHAFKRATGFFDVVCFTGSGTARTVAHNLNAVPELMIVKSRNSAYEWSVYSSALGNTKFLFLHSTGAAQTGSGWWNNTSPTASVFTVNTDISVNESAKTYVAYLFASVTGVSKVGTYTGNGSSQTINCGFTAGARFVLIKRTDSTGDWVTLDTARGIVSGNDPFLQLNSTAAEVTGEDIVDPDNSGFIVNSTTENINASGGTYIYLAIA